MGFYGSNDPTNSVKALKNKFHQGGRVGGITHVKGMALCPEKDCTALNEQKIRCIYLRKFFLVACNI